MKTLVYNDKQAQKDYVNHTSNIVSNLFTDTDISNENAMKDAESDFTEEFPDEENVTVYDTIDELEKENSKELEKENENEKFLDELRNFSVGMLLKDICSFPDPYCKPYDRFSLAERQKFVTRKIVVSKRELLNWQAYSPCIIYEKLGVYLLLHCQLDSMGNPINIFPLYGSNLPILNEVNKIS